MNRRAFLRHFVASTVCLCPVCAALTRPARADDHPSPHWEYEGENGPADWSRLAPEYAACGIGREQSPIDLDQPVAALLGPVAPNWQAMGLEVWNNGHTIQVNCPPGSTLSLDGVNYTLLQYHFHHPSEHQIAGVSFALEAHFVHRSAQGTLAVLGVLLGRGPASSALETIWRNLPEKAGDKVITDATFNPVTLLPKDSTTYRYAGSLTTPPCSEVVSWVVYRQPVTASAEQIERFARLFPNNARPPQPLGRRKLLLDLL